MNLKVYACKTFQHYIWNFLNIFFIWNLIDMTIWKLKGWLDVHSCARIWGLLICCSICMSLYLCLQCNYSLFYHALSDLWASGRQPDGHDNRGQKNCPDFWDEGGYWPLSNRYTYLTVWCQMLGHQTMNGDFTRGIKLVIEMLGWYISSNHGLGVTTVVALSLYQKL